MTSSSPYMSCRDFLKMAVRFEGESALFYRNMQAEIEEEGSVRQLLKMLEREEMSHARILSEFEVVDPDAVIQFPVNPSDAMPALPEGKLNLAALVEYGIERECCAKEIYTAAASSVSGSFRELLLGLARFEQEHEERLKSLRNL